MWMHQGLFSGFDPEGERDIPDFYPTPENTKINVKYWDLGRSRLLYGSSLLVSLNVGRRWKNLFLFWLVLSAL